MVTIKEKNLNIKIPEDTHYKIKMQALKEKLSMRDFIINTIEKYIYEKEELNIEPAEEEDFEGLEEARKDLAEGRVKTLAEIEEEYPCR
jgi:hypothetical protein